MKVVCLLGEMGDVLKTAFQSVRQILGCALVALGWLDLSAGASEFESPGLWKIYLQAAAKQEGVVAEALRQSALREAEQSTSNDAALERTLVAIGVVQAKAEGHVEAEALFRRAWKQLNEKSDPDLREMVSAGLGQALLKLDRPKEAIPFQEVALELCFERLKTDRELEDLSGTVSALAKFFLSLGGRSDLHDRIFDLAGSFAALEQWEQREALYQKWTDYFVREEDPALHQPAVSLWTRRAEADREAKRFDGAIVARKRLLDLKRLMYGEGSKDVVDELNMVGVIESEAGRVDQAVAYFRQALGLAENLKEANAPLFLRNFVFCLSEKERAAEAEPVVQDWVKRLTERADSQLPLAETLIELSKIKTSTGDYPAALEACARARELLQKPEEQASVLAECHNQAGIVYYKTENYSEALTFFVYAVEAVKGESGGGNDQYKRNEMEALYGLAVQQHDAGAYPEARQLFEKVYEKSNVIDGPESNITENVLYRIGFAYEREGLFDEALVAYGKALEITEKLESSRAIRLLRALASVYRATDSPDTDGLISRWVARFREESGAKENLATSLIIQGVFEMDRGLYESALQSLVEARRWLRFQGGETTKEYASVINHIGVVHYRAGRFAQAEEMFRQAFAIGQEVGDPNTRQYAENIWNTCKQIGDEEKIRGAKEILDSVSK